MEAAGERGEETTVQGVVLPNVRGVPGSEIGLDGHHGLHADVVLRRNVVVHIDVEIWSVEASQKKMFTYLKTWKFQRSRRCPKRSSRRAKERN